MKAKAKVAKQEVLEIIPGNIYPNDLFKVMDVETIESYLRRLKNWVEVLKFSTGNDLFLIRQRGGHGGDSWGLSVPLANLEGKIQIEAICGEYLARLSESLQKDGKPAIESAETVGESLFSLIAHLTIRLDAIRRREEILADLRKPFVAE